MTATLQKHVALSEYDTLLQIKLPDIMYSKQLVEIGESWND